ncbi:MAG: ribonuclease H-like domain-containing protein [Candidatus Heimdallarchaeota archaeon]
MAIIREDSHDGFKVGLIRCIKIEGFDIDGRLAGMLYSRFLETGDEIDWDKLLEYNKDDVMITKKVLRTLLKFE